jgi:hypothetical protein
MNEKAIWNQVMLREEILALKNEQKKCEILIGKQSSEIYEVARNPSPYIKRVAKELVSDKDFRVDLLKLGLNFASTYLSGKLTNPTFTKSPILSVLLKFLGNKQETNKYADILETISKLFSQKKNKA